MTENGSASPANIANSSKKYWMIGSAAMFLAASPFLPTPSGMPDKGYITLAVLFVAISLWLTEIIAAAVTSILVIVLFPLFQILTFEEAAAGLGKDVIWLIICMLSLGIAVEKTGLDKRISFYMLNKSGGSTYRTILLLILIAFLLTFFIPNGMGRLAVLLPIAIGLIKELEKEGGPNFNKSVILSITYVPWISTVVIVTGANGSIYAASLFQSMLGFKWSYLHWFSVMLPGTLTVLIGLWIILVKLFPPEADKIEQGQRYFEKNLAELSSVKPDEKKLIALYALLLTLWVTKEINGLSISMSACLVTVLAFLPGINLLSWNEVVKKVDWGIPLLFAAGFSIALALDQSGIITWLSKLATSYLSGLPSIVLAVVLMLLFLVLRIGFTHYAAMVASLMPVVLTFGIATAFNPVWIGMICLVASTMAYILPTQSISNMTTYALGYYTASDMIKAGTLLSIMTIIVTIVFAYFYWPIVGVPVQVK